MENSLICGYITSKQNHTPVTANVSLYWQGSQVDSYHNATVADEQVAVILLLPGGVCAELVSIITAEPSVVFCTLL